jgi:protein-disulfide isomerase
MRSSTVLISAIVIGALLGGAVMGIPSLRHRLIPVTTASTDIAAPVATATTETTTPAAPGTPVATAPDTTATAATAPAAGTPTASTIKIDVEAALTERTLGDKNAPVVFYDYSSLSCPHCAEFHTTVLSRLKSRYIDSGKVKMVFRPFPLNEPALMGEKIARCLPESEYFTMLDLLFSSQEKWVFGDTKANLRQVVKVAGVTDALFDACINNKELEDGIVAISQKGVEKFNIKGTPTFIFGSDGPDGEIVTGETDYDSFSQRLDGLLTQKMISLPQQ